MRGTSAVACGARPPGLEWEGLSSGSSLLVEMNGSEGGSVKAIREDCPPGKEEGIKVLSSISTSFPRRWKSRPAQRFSLWRPSRERENERAIGRYKKRINYMRRL
ncbi:hypothetical protein ABFS83_02G107700 [Erythranthe nasuta]